jgi:hypothetical protein
MTALALPALPEAIAFGLGFDVGVGLHRERPPGDDGPRLQGGELLGEHGVANGDVA